MKLKSKKRKREKENTSSQKRKIDEPQDPNEFESWGTSEFDTKTMATE